MKRRVPRLWCEGREHLRDLPFDLVRSGKFHQVTDVYFSVDRRDDVIFEERQRDE